MLYWNLSRTNTPGQLVASVNKVCQPVAVMNNLVQAASVLLCWLLLLVVFVVDVNAAVVVAFVIVSVAFIIIQSYSVVVAPVFLLLLLSHYGYKSSCQSS